MTPITTPRVIINARCNNSPPSLVEQGLCSYRGPPVTAAGGRARAVRRARRARGRGRRRCTRQGGGRFRAQAASPARGNLQRPPPHGKTRRPHTKKTPPKKSAPPPPPAGPPGRAPRRLKLPRHIRSAPTP